MSTKFQREGAGAAPFKRPGGLRNVAAAILALAVLAGCQSHGPGLGYTPPKPDETKVKQFAQHGYLTDKQYGVATSHATWSIGDESLDVTISVPDIAGVFPLVVYLPALGETHAAGETWRHAWTQAGYAVIAFQPVADDSRAWSSPRARSGDFAALARERYAAKAVGSRLAALGGALQELRRRHEKKEAPLDQVDLTKIAVAGFDLGAYTAMSVAGETLRGVTPPPLPLPIAAVIALSPYADFSGAGFAERYGSIHGPVLSVTGDNDTDALGLVTSPSVRQAPYQYMPGGSKYLLTLSDMTHATLGGNDALSGAEAEGDHREQGRQADSGSPGGGPAGGGPAGGNRKGGGRKSGGDRSGSGGSRGAPGAVPAPGMMQVSPTAQAIAATAVQGVTAAFLDAYVKNDAIAREWLEKDAARWLRDMGRITRK